MDSGQTFYDAIGGYPDHREDRGPVLRGVAEDEVLRPLYPEEDLGPAEERFRLFLVQYWGGPTTYSDTARPPAAADAARAVRGDAARPRSTGCCTSGPGSTRST